MQCTMCKKKVTIVTGYPCDCGYNFCAKHRLRDDHSCPNLKKHTIHLIKVEADKVKDRL